VQLERPPAVLVVAHFVGDAPADERDPKVRDQVDYEDDGVDVLVEFFALVEEDVEAFVADQNDEHRSDHVENVGVEHGDAGPAEGYPPDLSPLHRHHPQDLGTRVTTGDTASGTYPEQHQKELVVAEELVVLVDHLTVRGVQLGPFGDVPRPSASSHPFRDLRYVELVAVEVGQVRHVHDEASEWECEVKVFAVQLSRWIIQRIDRRARKRAARLNFLLQRNSEIYKNMYTQ
jgi:hypothetical protein